MKPVQYLCGCTYNSPDPWVNVSSRMGKSDEFVLCDRHAKGYKQYVSACKKAEEEANNAVWFRENCEYVIPHGSVRSALRTVTESGIESDHKKMFMDWAARRIQENERITILRFDDTTQFIFDRDPHDLTGASNPSYWNVLLGTSFMLGRQVDDPIDSDEWMRYAFYNVPDEIRADYELLLGHSTDLAYNYFTGSYSDDKQAKFIAVTKSEAKMESSRRTRTEGMGPDLAYLWAEYFGTDDLVEANRLRKEKFPRILRPADVKQYKRKGFSEEDILRLHEVLGHWSSFSDEPTIQTLEGLYEAGLTNDDIVDWDPSELDGLYVALRRQSYISINHFEYVTHALRLKALGIPPEHATDVVNLSSKMARKMDDVTREDVIEKFGEGFGMGFPYEWVIEFVKGQYIESDEGKLKLATL